MRHQQPKEALTPFDWAEECDHPHYLVGRMVGIDAARVDHADNHENEVHNNASAHRRENRGCKTPYLKAHGCASHHQQAIGLDQSCHTRS